MNFKPPFDQPMPDNTAGVPLGLSPEGCWVFSAAELPELQMPERVAVRREFIEIDGWVFPLANLTKSLLIWLHASFARWAKEDDSARNHDWIQGIADAFEDGVKGEL